MDTPLRLGFPPIAGTLAELMALRTEIASVVTCGQCRCYSEDAPCPGTPRCSVRKTDPLCSLMLSTIRQELVAIDSRINQLNECEVTLDFLRSLRTLQGKLE